MLESFYGGDDNRWTLQNPPRQDVDDELVSRILAGEAAAFERLVEKYHPRLFQLVRGIVGDWQRSEDVCQEVFVNVYLKLPDFHRRSRLSTWLYRIAVNAALKARARARTGRELALETVGQGPAHWDDVTSDLESRDLLGKLLRPLPRHLRAAVLLREREGLTYKEIARVLGCSAGAVEQRLHRAFTTLREVWQGRLGELGLEE